MKTIRIAFSILTVFVMLLTSCKEIYNKEEETNKQKKADATIVAPSAMSDQWKFIGEGDT